MLPLETSRLPTLPYRHPLLSSQSDTCEHVIVLITTVCSDLRGDVVLRHAIALKKKLIRLASLAIGLLTGCISICIYGTDQG